MKPTDAYIKWLMAPEREEFRKRVKQEWVPRIRDIFRVGWAANEYVIVAYDSKSGGIWAICLEDMTARLDFWSQEELREDACIWLPSLSQWLDMLVEADAEPILESQSGIRALQLSWLCFDDASSEPGRTSDWEAEPEIAAAQLWGRLEGVE